MFCKHLYLGGAMVTWLSVAIQLNPKTRLEYQIIMTETQSRDVRTSHTLSAPHAFNFRIYLLLVIRFISFIYKISSKLASNLERHSRGGNLKCLGWLNFLAHPKTHSHIPTALSLSVRGCEMKQEDGIDPGCRDGLVQRDETGGPRHGNF